MHSLSTIERGNPPPRRKSCSACIKAKRRCDLGQPSCLRCTQRQMQCSYSSTIPRSRSRTTTVRYEEQVPSPATMTPAEFELPAMAIGTGSADISMSSEQLLMFGSAFDAEFATTPLSDHDMNFLDFIDEELPGSTGEKVLSFSGFSQQSLDLLTHPKELPVVPLEGEWTSITIRAAIRDRLQYTLDKAKLAPKMMVDELETPWCHPTLYNDDMPRSMQDALAACGLYQNKNPRNASVILRTIRDRTQDLIASPPPTAPLEMLARAQALLLYATILVFDGDFISLLAAEAATPALEAAAVALAPVMGIEAEVSASDSRPRLSADSSEKRDLPLYPIGPAREFWRNWVLQESMRRTYLMTFFVTQLYWMLSGDVPKQCEPRLYMCHFWTVSSHLWRAKDAFEFALAWRDRRHFVINHSNFREVLETAMADDIDDFAKMILAALMGIDEMKGWLHIRGGSL